MQLHTTIERRTSIYIRIHAHYRPSPKLSNWNPAHSVLVTGLRGGRSLGCGRSRRGDGSGTHGGLWALRPAVSTSSPANHQCQACQSSGRSQWYSNDQSPLPLGEFSSPSQVFLMKKIRYGELREGTARTHCSRTTRVLVLRFKGYPSREREP